jgi:Arc/MetJ-type ribon-helix-helix transcriptional regulator
MVKRGAVKTNNIVSVRIPSSMIKDLKEKMQEDYFMDISEAIRNIVRNKYLQATNPNSKLDQIKSEILESVKKRVETDVSSKVLTELDKIREMLAGGKN